MESLDLSATDPVQNISFGFFNDTLDYEDDVPTSIFKVLMAGLYCMVCVLGLAGNSLVIAIILHLDKMKTVANIYIFNLAVADGLFMLGLPFLALQMFLNRWIFGSFMCKLVMILDGINQFTSVFCLTVMSVDRYLAVVHPIRFSKWRSPNVAKIVSILLWFFSFLPVIPMGIYSRVEFSLCIFVLPAPYETWSAAFMIYTFVLGFALPFIVISLCYMLLVVKLRTAVINPYTREAEVSEKRVTKMVVTIVVVFAICWLPFYIINFCFLLMPLATTLSLTRLFEFVVLLSYSNSCANPILYACLSTNFRRSFQRILCPKKSSRGVREESSLENYQLNDLPESRVTLSSGE
ncbi:somatostatin receptor type 2-like [Acipenser ruthenus]|uniref:somatostatin receptor type 2-like n=1 Tax=Acipenser ruthenus TaxID=7906 RepID=UPI00145AFE42|nr:somatostatin receptor type 2-like [Acipenser ruthenus]